MKKKNNSSENYLDRVPQRNNAINWTTDEKGIVTLEIQNNGLMNRICQKLFKKAIYISMKWEALYGHLLTVKKI